MRRPDGTFEPRDQDERFWEKVDRGPDCWLWTTVITSWGYGHFKAKVDGRWRYVKAHRYAYERLVGEIPTGLTVDHLCRVRSCVNPAHMELVPIAENIRRGNPRSKQLAARATCPAGHPFNDENTVVYGTTRLCRPCRAANARRVRARRRARPARTG